MRHIPRYILNTVQTIDLCGGSYGLNNRPMGVLYVQTIDQVGLNIRLGSRFLSEIKARPFVRDYLFHFLDKEEERDMTKIKKKKGSTRANSC